jgi:cytochrome c oxidase cbb3-type subunit 3
MSAAWSWFVIAIVASNLVGCAWLLWWTARRRGTDAKATTGHVWDGDLTEYNKPLPRWWINLFWLTIVFAIAYVAWYPGLGNFAGAGKWTSRGQLAAETAHAEKQLAAAFAGLDGKPLAAVAADPHAIATGRRVFLDHCAMCHGSDARGGKGFPNLTDASWQWGGSEEQILASILDGRDAQMPPLGNVVGSETAITAVAVYVQGLSGAEVSQAVARPGAATYAAVCAGCHGAEGKGNIAIGAPDLSDDAWLYGPRLDDIRAAIRDGHAGRMPAHRTLLGPTRAKLAAAYVYSLSHGAPAAGAHAGGAGAP